jgi:hypothetical protein
MTAMGETKVLKKTYPSATLPTINPTSAGLKSNPDLNGERPLPARGIAWP